MPDAERLRSVVQPTETTPVETPPVETPLAETSRSRLRRKRDRGHHDRATVEAILDEALVAHVGVVADGTPLVLPMAYARLDDQLYLHGAAANHLLSSAGGTKICVTVTLLDGVVLARSAFHHSMNYRSVALFGPAVVVTDPDEKRRGLDALVDHVQPGRSEVARPPTANELRATTVIRLAITEGSAKVRTGGPNDEPDDLEWPAWAGHIPLTLTPGPPVADEHTPDSLTAPVARDPGRLPR
jgi:uncharacterized protein